MDTRNHSNFCACNFTRIVGCDFSYVAPVTSHQLLQSNYTLIHKLIPTPIGMNLTLVKQLLLHQDLAEILGKIKKDGQKTLVTVHHNVKQIHRVMGKSKERCRAQVVGYSFWVVTNCHKCPEHHVSSYCCPFDPGFDWFCFVSNLVCHELENDETVNKTDVHN